MTSPVPSPAADRGARPAPRTRTGLVRNASRVTPDLVRIVLGGPDLAELPLGAHTDAYVKLVFPPADAPYRTAEEFTAMRPTLEPHEKPVLRTYTVRRYDKDTAELTIDVVTHGDEGLAGPWAASVQPGDEIMMLGPGGGYSPDPDAAWHLLIGDESALPAIAASIEGLATGARAYVFVEVANAAEEQELSSAADVEVTWVRRDETGGGRGDGLVEAVSAADLPTGDGHAFLHGEAGLVKRLRHHLRFERGIAPERLSVSGYWRAGRDDEGWRAEKSAWRAEVDADEAAHAAGSPAS